MIANLCNFSSVKNVNVADYQEIWGNMNTLCLLSLLFSP